MRNSELIIWPGNISLIAMFIAGGLLGSSLTISFADEESQNVSKDLTCRVTFDDDSFLTYEDIYMVQVLRGDASLYQGELTVYEIDEDEAFEILCKEGLWKREEVKFVEVGMASKSEQ